MGQPSPPGNANLHMDSLSVNGRDVSAEENGRFPGIFGRDCAVKYYVITYEEFLSFGNINVFQHSVRLDR